MHWETYRGCAIREHKAFGNRTFFWVGWVKRMPGWRWPNQQCIECCDTLAEARAAVDRAITMKLVPAA